MRVFLILLLMVGLAACGDGPKSAAPSAPSIKRVDSAVRAAPDTIRAMPVDSVRR